jgi:hypothetical protein
MPKPKTQNSPPKNYKMNHTYGHGGRRPPPLITRYEFEDMLDGIDHMYAHSF